MEKIIKTSSIPGNMAADLFMLLGSTIKAAIKSGRSAIGIELEEGRLQQLLDTVQLINA
ncbi:DNA methyltransferase [Pantoea anthophila]|uniref:DNA methyltransferase n=1 Tax=Pantoea anthophila TaxID=470931 RepID=UPI0027D84E6C|nr:DNA methyltransferase [Pantoea anthophila]